MRWRRELLAAFLHGMRVGSPGFAVLLAGTVNALLAQMAIAAHVGIDEFATDDNADRKQKYGCSNHNKSQYEDFFHAVQ